MTPGHVYKHLCTTFRFQHNTANLGPLAPIFGLGGGWALLWLDIWWRPWWQSLTHGTIESVPSHDSATASVAVPPVPNVATDALPDAPLFSVALLKRVCLAFGKHGWLMMREVPRMLRELVLGNHGLVFRNHHAAAALPKCVAV